MSGQGSPSHGPNVGAGVVGENDGDMVSAIVGDHVGLDDSSVVERAGDGAAVSRKVPELGAVVSIKDPVVTLLI